MNVQTNNTRSAQRARPTQEVKDEIVAMFRSGESAEEVANCYQVGKSTVYAFARAAAIKEQMRKTRSERRMAASINKDVKVAVEAHTLSVDAKSDMGNTALKELVAKQAAEIEVLKKMLLEALLKNK